MEPMRLASLSIRPMAVATSSRGLQCAVPVELGKAPDGHQRSAQFVRGVGGEPPHPVLGGHPCGERRLDVGQHGVQGTAEPAHLRVRILHSTRRDRSPAAMAAAVFSTRASGRKDRDTVQVAMKKARSSVSRPTPTTTSVACPDVVHRRERQADDHHGPLLVAVNDADGNHTPVFAVGAADLVGLAAALAASSTVMEVMSGSGSSLSPNGPGPRARIVDDHRVIGGDAGVGHGELAKGPLLARRI